ncbi:MAG: hypothetical protein FWD73_09040 [Polyangiaceae bacterium]|nr:hypothetical protein [Polyangiaceae bacterium]
MAVASAVGIGACASQGSDAQLETQPSGNGVVQSLTRDLECNSGVASRDDVLYSATWSGGANGTLNLGNGGTATIFNSDGVYFDWLATTPIAVVYVYGDALRQDVFSYDPAATHGERLFPPKNPDDQDMQLPLYAIKFCFRDASVTTDAGADSGTGTDAGTVTDAGADASQHDAAPKPLPNYTW